jgi:hypothetical protein
MSEWGQLLALKMPNWARKQAAGVVDVIWKVNMSSGPARHPADPLQAAAK